ncbi:MAG: ABC transporter permease [Firmicutes bacterium]|nr:ABC transporter permease [Bacillota bacterium]
MMNIIRADVYRIVRGKAIYITFTVLLALSLLEVFTFNGRGVSFGINTDVIDMTMGGQMNLDGVLAARLLLTTMDNLIYFILPLFIAVAMSMFSSGAIKNELASGIPRVRLYAAKWILSAILCVLLMLTYVACGAFAATVTRGLGRWSGAALRSILTSCGAQMVLMLAFNSIGILLAFATRHSAAVNGAYIAFALVPTMVIALFSNRYISFEKYYNYDLSLCMKLFSYVDKLPGTDIIRGLCIGTAYILVTTVLGITLFKRAEIK